MTSFVHDPNSTLPSLSLHLSGEESKGGYLLGLLYCMGTTGFDVSVNRLTFLSGNSIGNHQRTCFGKLDLLTLKSLDTFKDLRILIGRL